MTAVTPPPLQRYRNFLRLLAEIELSPRLRVKEAASAIVPQSLQESHRDLPSYRYHPESELVRWLKTILARNIRTAARHYRTQNCDVRREQPVADRVEQSTLCIEKFLASEQTSPSQQAGQNEQTEQLLAGSAQLLEGEQTAIVLKHFQGCSLSQISEQMGSPPHAITGLLKCGLKKLRSHLQPEPE